MAMSVFGLSTLLIVQSASLILPGPQDSMQATTQNDPADNSYEVISCDTDSHVFNFQPAEGSYKCLNVVDITDTSITYLSIELKCVGNEVIATPWTQPNCWGASKKPIVFNKSFFNGNKCEHHEPDMKLKTGLPQTLLDELDLTRQTCGNNKALVSAEKVEKAVTREKAETWDHDFHINSCNDDVTRLFDVHPSKAEHKCLNIVNKVTWSMPPYSSIYAQCDGNKVTLEPWSKADCDGLSLEAFDLNTSFFNGGKCEKGMKLMTGLHENLMDELDCKKK